MQNAVFKARLAMVRWEQTLAHLFMMVHLFGHKDEGGLDSNTMETISAIIELMQKELKLTGQLLDNMDNPQQTPPPAAEIRKFKIVS